MPKWAEPCDFIKRRTNGSCHLCVKPHAAYLVFSFYCAFLSHFAGTIRHWKTMENVIFVRVATPSSPTITTNARDNKIRYIMHDTPAKAHYMRQKTRNRQRNNEQKKKLRTLNCSQAQVIRTGARARDWRIQNDKLNWTHPIIQVQDFEFLFAI